MEEKLECIEEKGLVGKARVYGEAPLFPRHLNVNKGRPNPIPKDGIELAMRAFEVFRGLPESVAQAATSAKIISGRSPYPVVCFPWLHRAFMPDGTPID